MFADMTKENGHGSVPISGWKVAYFRVIGWESGDAGEVLNPNQAPVMEICLVPVDTSIEEFKNHNWQNKEIAFRIPPRAQVIRVRAGDPWPQLQDELLKINQEEKNCTCQGFHQPIDCPVHVIDGVRIGIDYDSDID